MDDFGVTVDCGCCSVFCLSWCMQSWDSIMKSHDFQTFKFVDSQNCMAGTVPLSVLGVIEKACAFLYRASSCACAQYELWLCARCCTMAVRLWFYYGCMLMAVVLGLYYVCIMIALHNKKSRSGSCSIADLFVFSFLQTLRCDSWYTHLIQA